MSSALAVISVLNFSVTYAKITSVLKFVLFKLQQAPLAKAKHDFFLSDFYSKKTISVTHHKGPSIKYLCKTYIP